MALRTPKILVHSDGTPFAVWNPGGRPRAYAMYFTDEDVPPKPESLNIKQTGGFPGDIKGARWMPVTVQAQEEHVLLEPYEP